MQAAVQAISSEIFLTALQITTAVAAIIILLWVLAAEVQAVAQAAPGHQEEVAEALRL